MCALLASATALAGQAAAEVLPSEEDASASAAAAPADTEPADEASFSSRAKGWLKMGEPPAGSLQYSLPMVEFGLQAGTLPLGGGLGAGFRYMERGSLLAQMVFGASSAAGAGARAATTGEDQTYYVDVSPESTAGFSIDYRNGGGDGDESASGLDVDFFYSIPFADDQLPWIIDFGLTGGAYSGPDRTDGEGYLGLVFGLIAPITPWAQAEARVRVSIGDELVHGEAGVVGNLTNRFFARAALHYYDSAFFGLTGGMRL